MNRTLRCPDRIRRRRRRADSLASGAVSPGGASGSAGPQPGPTAASPPPAPPPREDEIATLLSTLVRVRCERGLGVDEVARQLHVPSAVLRELESGALLGTGAPVYVRGLLRSYARLLSLPADALQAHVPAVPDPAALIAALPSTRPGRLARLAHPTVYALLTAVVLVPLIYLAAPERQRGPAPTALKPIDGDARELGAAPAAADPRADAARLGVAPDVLAMGPPEPAAGAPSTASAAPAPMMASMAPVAERSQGGTTVRHVVLTLRNESWVQFVGADGKRLEYALLPAGTRREYRVAGPAELMIGNAPGAMLELDGQPVDLARYTRANVARLALDAE